MIEIGALEGEAVEDVDEVEKLLLGREDDLEKLVAISRVKRAVQEGVTRSTLGELREGIEGDIRKFRALLDSPPPTKPGQHRSLHRLC